MRSWPKESHRGERGARAAIETFELPPRHARATPAPLREAAGVFAVREDWPRAAKHAREAVRRNQRDQHAWRILATSGFVTGDSAGALEAWNQAGEPVIDLVSVQGLEHTRTGRRQP